MEIGMATRKVTVTLDEGDVARIKGLVRDGSAASVSAFVQRAVASSLDADAIWAQTLSDLLDETGGPVTPEEQAWASEILAPDSAAS